jgi:hypothetical protein
MKRHHSAPVPLKHHASMRLQHRRGEKMPATPPSPAWLDVLKLVVDVLRILVWPALVVGAFIVFKGPILSIANELPLKFSAATKVGVGSLVLEIQQQARAAGNPQLALRIGKLSPEAIRHLMQMGESHMILVGSGKDPQGNPTFVYPEEKRVRAARELAANGLVEFKEDIDAFFKWIESDRFRRTSPYGRSDSRDFVPTSPLSPAEELRLKDQYYKLNDLGRKAWQAVLDAVLEQLRTPEEKGSLQSADSPTAGQE